VELDVISIVALRGPVLLEETDAVMTQNAAAVHAVLMELAWLCISQQCRAMGVVLGKAKIVAAGILRTIQIVSTSRVIVRTIVEVVGNLDCFIEIVNRYHKLNNSLT